jgi:radical SAM protein with 4Fe4S-binding SPASM domain
MELSAPIHVHWELTNVCNLKCLHCYQQDDGIRHKALPKEALFAIAKRLVNAGVFQITLTGGEPFAVQSLSELVNYFNFNKIIPHITSNGTLINRNTISWLSKARVTIQISLDSYRREIHNHIRQNDSAYELALAAVDLLSEYDIPVSLAFCANKHNYHDIEGLIDLAIEHKVGTLMIGDILPLYGPELLRDQMSFTSFEYNDFVQNAVFLKNAYKSTLDIRINTEWGFLYSDEIQHSPCTALDRDFAILYDGFVYPCPFIRHENSKIGSLLESDVKSIWKSEKASAFRTQKHQGCAVDCPHYARCRGGCKASLANQNLDITGRDPHCPVYANQL